MKKYLFLVLASLSFCYHNKLNAQVVISGGTGGTGICTNNAMHRTYLYGLETTPGNIMIRETNPGDFAVGFDTLLLKLPPGWEFGTCSLYLNSSAYGDLVSLAMMTALDSITLYVRIAHTTMIDTIYMGGFGIVAKSDSAPDGYIYAKSLKGISGITLGPTGTNFGDLSLSPKPIGGPATFCIGGGPATVTDAVSGGTWTSTTTAIATIDGSTGAVTGVAPGTDTLIYTLSTCTISRIINVTTCPANVHNVANGTDKVDIFPNPAGDNLTISVAYGTYNFCIITNTVGQELVHQPLSGKQITVPVRSLPRGIYFVTLSGDNGNTTLRFVK
jgi:hypothetical protein